MNTERRRIIQLLGSLLGLSTLSSTRLFADIPTALTAEGNFHYIYSRPALKQEFLNFMINVFHLFPERELHDLITMLSNQYSDDREIYVRIQSGLSMIKPFLGDLRYSVPALNHQKKTMQQQTIQLVDTSKKYQGYLEIGSTGRYLDTLEEKISIQGDVFFVHTTDASYGLADMIDRGQISKAGKFINMGDYATTFASIIPKNSLDLITVYIGFHHCPIDKRQEYISAVRDVLKPGGRLILRDHNAHNEDMRRMAALAHDVFNAGTEQSWDYNQHELRNFYSLDFITNYVSSLGFKHDGKILYQDGDPTLNALTAFTKV